MNDHLDHKIKETCNLRVVLYIISISPCICTPPHPSPIIRYHNDNNSNNKILIKFFRFTSCTEFEMLP